MPYQVTNISRTPIYENLDTKDVNGKREVLNVGVRKTVTLTDTQWGSFAVQRHIQKKRLRSKQV